MENFCLTSEFKVHKVRIDEFGAMEMAFGRLNPGVRKHGRKPINHFLNCKKPQI
jgi:hypothetical protein